jgi:predicted nucleotidyltransferase
VAAMKAKSLLRSPKIGNSSTIKILKGFLEGREQILLVFVFGSFATRRITSYSDIDIAILFESLPDVYETNQLRDELTGLLNRDTDVIVLNNASPILRMQVLKKGVLILSKERRYFHQFFVDTVNQYDDLKQIRKNCEDNILKRRIHA